MRFGQRRAFGRDKRSAATVALFVFGAWLVAAAAFAAPPAPPGAPAATAPAPAATTPAPAATAPAPAATAPAPAATAPGSAAGAAPAVAPTGAAAGAGPAAGTAATASAPPPIARPAEAEAFVRIRDARVFSVRVGRGQLSASQRAAAATAALERLVDEPGDVEVRVEMNGDTAVVWAGPAPVIQLGPADAAAAGDTSAEVHADTVANRIRGALRTERKRSAIAQTVFSISLLVFSALLAFVLLRKVGDLAERAHRRLAAPATRLPALHVRGIEVIKPAALRGGALVALSAGRALIQIGITYAWLLIALSLFETTRGYTERLTGAVLAPLATLMGRAASALPLVVVTAVAVLAVMVTVRFVGLFFGSVARGETRLSWLPSELAVPTGVLVRGGIVVLSLALAAPLITGTDDGALARAGVVTLAAIGLATTPLLASAAVGVAVVYGRHVTLGEWAEVGGRVGVVRAISLLEVRLEDEEGAEVRVPHLASLVHPTRMIGPLRRHTVEVLVANEASPARVRDRLAAVAATQGTDVVVETLRIDATGGSYAVSVRSKKPHARAALAAALVDTLADAQLLPRASSRTDGERA